MQWIKEHTDRIRALLAQDTEQSATYAALEARLAIERVCYERLRIAHDYIPQEELRGWQPARVVRTLLEEVDSHIASDFTLSMSTRPTDDGDHDEAADYDRYDYVEVGRQIGFDPGKLGKLWNALGNFLHVKVPTSKADHRGAYGDKRTAQQKVADVLVELDRLASGTLISNGTGPEVHFTCECGTLNRRRTSTLSAGKIIHCIKADCKETWEVSFEGEDVFFERRKITIRCYACGHIHAFPRQPIEAVGHNQVVTFNCEKCDAKTLVAWRLCYAKPPAWRPDSTDAHGPSSLQFEGENEPT